MALKFVFRPSYGTHMYTHTCTFIKNKTVTADQQTAETLCWQNCSTNHYIRGSGKLASLVVHTGAQHRHRQVLTSAEPPEYRELSSWHSIAEFSIMFFQLWDLEIGSSPTSVLILGIHGLPFQLSHPEYVADTPLVSWFSLRIRKFLLLVFLLADCTVLYPLGWAMFEHVFKTYFHSLSSLNRGDFSTTPVSQLPQ